jgi:hypothetical protein
MEVRNLTDRRLDRGKLACNRICIELDRRQRRSLVGHHEAIDHEIFETCCPLCIVIACTQQRSHLDFAEQLFGYASVLALELDHRAGDA